MPNQRPKFIGVVSQNQNSGAADPIDHQSKRLEHFRAEHRDQQLEDSDPRTLIRQN